MSTADNIKSTIKQLDKTLALRIERLKEAVKDSKERRQTQTEQQRRRD